MAKKTTPAPAASVIDFDMGESKPEEHVNADGTAIKPDETLPELDPVKLDTSEVEVTASDTAPAKAIPLSDSEKMDLVLGATSFPLPSSEVDKVRAGLKDLSPELQADLAREVHEILGKASGYIPDFNNLTENMKLAYFRAIAVMWNAAGRHVRTYRDE